MSARTNQSPEPVVREIRRNTRRKYSSEEKIRIGLIGGSQLWEWPEFFGGNTYSVSELVEAALLKPASRSCKSLAKGSNHIGGGGIEKEPYRKLLTPPVNYSVSRRMPTISSFYLVLFGSVKSVCFTFNMAQIDLLQYCYS